MLLLKITVSMLVVTGLSLVAERISPRAAGVLSGYPAGTAISLFFIGLEQGAGFAGQSAPYNITGMTAMLFFLYMYYQVSAHIECGTRNHGSGKLLSICIASLVAIPCFLLAVAGINMLRLPPWAGVLLTVAAIPVFIQLFRRIPDAAIARRVTFGPRALVTRSGLAALVILSVTGAAHLVKPGLAGLLTAFPTTVFPLILVIHTTYGQAQAHTIIKNVPQGLGALVAYSLVVAAAYPRVGVGWGTLMAFAGATAYLIFTMLVIKRTSSL